MSSAEAVERVAEGLVDLGAPDVMTYEQDLTAPGAAGELVDAVERRLGVVKVLVNKTAHREGPDETPTLDHAALTRTCGANLRPVLLTGELARRWPADTQGEERSVGERRARPVGQVGRLANPSGLNSGDGGETRDRGAAWASRAAPHVHLGDVGVSTERPGALRGCRLGSGSRLSQAGVAERGRWRAVACGARPVGVDRTGQRDRAGAKVIESDRRGPGRGRQCGGE